MKDNQRIVITKRMLQEGLLQLLAQKDIDKIKVTELCEVSGINRATFYRHYEMPRDVLTELRHSMFLEIETLTRTNVHNHDPQRALEQLCRYCFTHAKELTVLFETRADDGFTVLLNEFYQTHLAELRLVEQCFHIDSTELLLASYYYAGGIYSILRCWLAQPGSKTPEEIAALIFRIITADTNRLPEIPLA